MEQKYNAPLDKVFALLTDPKWLEARSLALVEMQKKARRLFRFEMSGQTEA